MPLFLSIQTVPDKSLALLEGVSGSVPPGHPASFFSWKLVNDTKAVYFAFSLLAQLKRTLSFIKALPHHPLSFFIVMETRRCSPAGGSSWQWIGFERGGTLTSRFLSHSGERSPLDKTAPLQVGHHPFGNHQVQSGDRGAVKNPVQVWFFSL